MNLKDCDGRRDDIAALTLLAGRCNPAQKKRLDEEYAKLIAGTAGEREAARIMNREFGESDRMGLLHDIRIGVRGEYAQIDHLVIHRVQGRIWLCETKNYGGRLQCDAHGEWTIWYGNRPQPVPSPIEQARLQAIVLRRWLEENGYGYLEVLPMVLCAPKSSVDRREIPEDVTIVKWDQFPSWWRDQAEKVGVLSAMRMCAGRFWEKRDTNWLRGLGAALCEAHEPITFDWERRLGLGQGDQAEEGARKADNVHRLPVKRNASSPETPSSQQSRLDLSPLGTPHGEITFRELGNGEVAIRNPPAKPLIEVVRGTVRGRGRWQPKYKNWIVKAEHFADLREQIESRLRSTVNRYWA
ncbi:nuclease-related domain-containing protein [Alteriqipengyuania flavescens]|uniref:nuclease-related domain-containing protein n=1 Tax=Alteriqipengyuania flavescens TaxID=3053610 RepID=UPI0025B4D5F3|nr:nuclease-related domain-containing protein [Alteriqipengyuania flavescens]WJY17466.1 nuclease-related domain-containing protein [Alteriqipengyuania flavescens]WJY23409.1 nuclease-related domain-containing protein [Alteriqipengyuania flavescens]